MSFRKRFASLCVTVVTLLIGTASRPSFLLVTASSPSSSSFCQPCCAFAAGGFGASSNSASSNKKSKPKKKRKGGILDSDLVLTPPPPTPPAEPKLDKWGLPPPTEEDIFPPLPTETEVIAAQKEPYSLTEIMQHLETYMRLPGLAEHFDEQGVETKSESSPSSPPVTMKLVHESPPVLVFDNFLTEQECLNVQRVAIPVNDNDDDDDSRQQSSSSSPSSQPTTVQVDSATFSTLAQSRRTSTSWFCSYAAVPTVLAKARHLLGVDVHCMEEPQIVRYKSGQEFSWHYDQVPTAQLDNGGQRIGTFLIYLNDVTRGGGTVFRDLRDGSNKSGQPLTVQPRQGRVCLFFPANRAGQPDDRTLHKGQVAEDEKRIIQIWFHERAYRASLPPNNRQEDALDAVEREAQRLGYQAE